MKLNLTIIALLGISLAFTLLLVIPKREESVHLIESLADRSPEELAEEGWIKGCVNHTVSEARGSSDVIDEKAATLRSRSFCKCDWDYMRQEMKLDLEEIVTIGEPDSRGTQAIIEAQDVCYQRLYSKYY